MLVHVGKDTGGVGYKLPWYIKGMNLQTPAWAVGAEKPKTPLKNPFETPLALKTQSSAKGDKDVVAVNDDDVIEPVEVTDEIRVLSADQHLGPRDFIMLSSISILGQMPKEERVLRTTFVREYLYDFDKVQAATRLGYLNVKTPYERYSQAEKVANVLMGEPGVARLIKECMLELINQEDSDKVVFTMLLREATNCGPSGNAAARNTATKQLMDLLLRAKDNRNQGEVVRGNVMVMPTAIENESDWEKRAKASQKELKDSIGA